MHVDIIVSNFINGAKAHFCQQRNSCLYRVNFKAADFLIFRNESIE